MTVSIDLINTLFKETMAKRSDASLPEIMTEALENAIVEGKIGSGQKLPTQRALAETFGVSRTAVREGLKILEAHNLVEADARGLYKIKEISISGLVEPLAALLAKNHNNFYDYLDASWAIDRAAASLAARKIGEADLFRLQDDVSDLIRFFEASNQNDLLSAADARFHQHLVEATENPILIDLTQALNLIFEKNYAPVRSNILHKNRELIDDHIRLYEAIKCHDDDKATQLIDKMHNAVVASMRILERNPNFKDYKV